MDQICLLWVEPSINACIWIESSTTVSWIKNDAPGIWSMMAFEHESKCVLAWITWHMILMVQLSWIFSLNHLHNMIISYETIHNLNQMKTDPGLDLMRIESWWCFTNISWYEFSLIPLIWKIGCLRYDCSLVAFWTHTYFGWKRKWPNGVWMLAMEIMP